MVRRDAFQCLSLCLILTSLAGKSLASSIDVTSLSSRPRSARISCELLCTTKLSRRLLCGCFVRKVRILFLREFAPGARTHFAIIFGLGFMCAGPCGLVLQCDFISAIDLTSARFKVR